MILFFSHTGGVVHYSQVAREFYQTMFDFSLLSDEG